MLFQGIDYDTQGLICIIPNGSRGDLIHEGRRIRYASNHTSIYWDKQVESKAPIKVPTLMLRDGILNVDDSQETLIEFLLKHPMHGVKFAKVDYEENARLELLDEELVDDIKYAIRQKAKQKDGDIALESLLIIKSKTENSHSVAKMGPLTIRRKLYTMAENSPEDFVNEKGEVNCFDSNDFIYQDIVIRCENEGIIKINPAQTLVSWANGESILDIPRSKDAVKYFADWLRTKEGKLVMKEMAKELG